MKFIPLIFVLFSFFSYGQNAAQDLFKDYQHSLYQIRIIDLESGKKSSIGSAFQVSEQGHLATNYHVISSYIFEPDNFRMEYLDSAGQSGDLILTGFDVINDLAVVKKTEEDEAKPQFLSLAQDLPEHGAPIYSLGNPRDLGMIVVPGTFNGLKKSSFYQRIHFTGSINPGMSGGPVIDEDGMVMGVNVATAGNSIGFLVPLPPLREVLNQAFSAPLQDTAFKPVIEQQLLENQQKMIAELTATDWNTLPLGGARIPDRIIDYISCWGGSNSSKQDALYLSIYNRCSLDEQIFVRQRLRTGALEMEFEWLQSDAFEQHRFYNFFANSFGSAEAGNMAGKDDVSSYKCNSQHAVNGNNMVNKSVLCLRAYKDFSQLYDVLFIAASLEREHAGLLSHFTLSGVDQTSALAFTRHFMESLAWQ